ncbi:MAG: hypothetical protein JRN45_06325 [Nitrososphaerota archaeon]|nr:hypothetical protein [Nitrososphaerota archaeon]
MKQACERGAEFFLERELHKEGARWEPWYRFHYPVHYYYDLLVGLDFMTALGYSEDERLGYAISLLKEKRRQDGRWVLDSNRPEESAALTVWKKKHPSSKDFTPLVLEQAGQPSKMITLTAMKVLARIGAAGRVWVTGCAVKSHASGDPELDRDCRSTHAPRSKTVGCDGLPVPSGE